MSAFSRILGPKRVKRPAGASPVWADPPIATLSQTVSNWCWLATAASVDVHYQGAATQCGLANALLNQPGVTCCVAPHSAACNQPGAVDQALGRHHDSTDLLSAAPVLADVQRALDNGRPPVAQFTFGGGGDHVVLLAAHGTDRAGSAVVQVGDPTPAYNPTDVAWSQAARYRGGVSWTHVCWTRP